MLASDNSGAYDIQILNARGEVRDTIDANLWDAQSIAWHPDGFFLSSNWVDVLRIDLDGQVTTFNNEPLPSSVFRVTVDDDGDVTVAQEYDVTEVDDEGDVVAHTTVPSTYCWMDASGGDNGEDPMLLDIFGPHLASWDVESGTFDVKATLSGGDLNILGRTGAGDFVAASNWGDHIAFVSADGQVNDLGGLTGRGVQAWQISAVEPAGAQSVYALYEGSMGSSIAQVDADGTVEPLFSAPGVVWRDMVVF